MITRSACLALLIAALSLPNAVPASAQCLPPERLFSDAVTGLIPDPADHVVVADFNSDGTTNLAIGGSGQRLGIKLGALGILGQVTFSDALYLPVHSTPMGFATGDFNGDHIPDLAIAAMDGDQIEIDLGSGRGAGWTMAQTDRRSEE